MRTHFAAAALVLLALVARPAQAQTHQDTANGVVDVWSEPNPGVRYLRRTTTLPCTIHALVVDLRVDGVAIVSTPHDERWRPVATWARERDVAAAVNGGFWGSLARVSGVAAGGGALWPDVADDADHGFFAIGRDGRARISPPEEVEDAAALDEGRIAEAVSGRPMLVRAGAVDLESLDAFERSRNRHPRTAVGVSRDGRTVYIVVADGRRQTSRGQNLYELAELMTELGAYAALNLDGGGSSTMYVDQLGGVVNAPSGGRWEAALGLGADDEVARERLARDGVPEAWVRGREREVINHLGVVAPPAPAVPISASTTLDGLPIAPTAGASPGREGPAFGPPAAPLFRLGASRELLYPALYFIALLVPLALAAALLRRRFRRR